MTCGAPFVTASGGTFSRFLHASVQNGHAALWGDAGVEARTVGMPGMNEQEELEKEKKEKERKKRKRERKAARKAKK